jgi:hypothetical protein
LPAIVTKPGVPREERWIVVAHKCGQWVPMWPHKEKLFPVCGSREEARERTELARMIDPVFAARWRGWHFVQVPLDTTVIL